MTPTRTLHVAKGLHLPLDGATETFAILGRRGSGKTHTAVVMAEEMLGAGIPVVVIDPLDVWWGLRVSKDGKQAGVPIYVAGGSHADIPLSVDAGKVIADAVVDKGFSIVLSIRHLSKTDQRRFVGEFCERLYDRKADPQHRTALHVFIDEADAFVPQRLMPGSERCFGAVDTLVRRGRSSGLAATLISQRPQVINKDVLSQTEVLVSHQLTGPQDRKALQAWIEANDTENQGGTFMASLASLAKGEAWFWSPGLLRVFVRVAVRDRHTFDSSATPKAGVVAVASPKAFAAVDLDALTKEIAATIERAKADDPRELRKQIVELKKQLAQVATQAHPKSEPNRQALTEADRALLEKVGSQVAETARQLTSNAAYDIDQVIADVEKRLQQFRQDLLNELIDVRTDFLATLERKGLQRVLDKLPAAGAAALPRERPARAELRGGVLPTQRQPQPRVSPAGSHDGSPLPPGEHAVLTAALQYPDGLDRKRLCILTGYKRSSRDAYIVRLSSKGLVSVIGACLYPTDAGRAALNGSFEPLPTGEELVEYWRQRLPEGERKTLDVLVQAGGSEVAREAIDEATGYKRSSRDAYLVRLKARGLVEFAGRGTVRASEELFS